MNKKAAVTTALVFLVLFVVFLMMSVMFYVLYGEMADSVNDALAPISQDTVTGLMVVNFLNSKVSPYSGIGGVSLDFVVDGTKHDMTYAELIALGAESEEAWGDIVDKQINSRKTYFSIGDLIYAKDEDQTFGDDEWGFELLKDGDSYFMMGDDEDNVFYGARRKNANPIWITEKSKQSNLLWMGNIQNVIAENAGFFEDFLIPLSNGDFVIARYHWRPRGLIQDD